MERIKQSVAKNITDLRRSMGMTQLELAEKLNYSDKAVSKWERGDSIPDVAVLKQISDLFGVTLDYLVSEDHKSPVTERTVYSGRELRNRRIITESQNGTISVESQEGKGTTFYIQMPK